MYEAKSWQEAQATRCNSCRQLKNRCLGGPPFPLEAYLWAGPYLWAGRLLRPCRIQQRRPRRDRRTQPVRKQCPARRTHQASTQRAKHRPGRPTHTPVRQHRLRGRWSWIRTTSGSVLTVDLLQDLLQQLCMKCQHHRIAPMPPCETPMKAMCVTMMSVPLMSRRTMALRALKTTKRAQKCACDEGLVAGVVPCCHGPCLQGDDELAHDEFDNAGNAETKWLQACRSPPYRV